MYAGEYYADSNDYRPGSDDDEQTPFSEAMSQLAEQARHIERFERGE
jgi:hypothetical protein